MIVRQIIDANFKRIPHESVSFIYEKGGRMDAKCKIIAGFFE